VNFLEGGIFYLSRWPQFFINLLADYTPKNLVVKIASRLKIHAQRNFSLLIFLANKSAQIN